VYLICNISSHIYSRKSAPVYLHTIQKRRSLTSYFELCTFNTFLFPNCKYPEAIQPSACECEAPYPAPKSLEDGICKRYDGANSRYVASICSVPNSCADHQFGMLDLYMSAQICRLYVMAGSSETSSSSSDGGVISFGVVGSVAAQWSGVRLMCATLTALNSVRVSAAARLMTRDAGMIRIVGFLIEMNVF
jgi:hypothetical protein